MTIGLAHGGVGFDDRCLSDRGVQRGEIIRGSLLQL
jgi:hypothetical protein